MAAPPGTKFYTYKPGASNVPKGGSANQLTLQPGQTTGYQEGSGYWAVNAPAPAPNPGVAPGAVAAPPAAPAGSWKFPDYDAIINGDYGVADAEAQGRKTIGQGETDFQQQLRQAFIDFGASDTSRLGDYAKYIDAATIEAAKANKFSQIAQSLKGQTRNMRRSLAANAARGMLRSGQTTQDAKNALEAREGADYSSLRGFLGGAEERTQSLANLRTSVANQIRAERGAAAARAYANNPGVWDPGTPAGTPPGAPGGVQSGDDYRMDRPAVPGAGISWGGKTGITTIAGMKAALASSGYNGNYAKWASQHPAAAAGLK